MIHVLQVLFDAISVGSIYALSALGIGLVFGIMRLINFAHGEFIMVGAYTALLSAATWFPVAVVIAVAVVVVLALLTERLAFRPVRTASPATMLITSFAISYLIQNLMVMTLGARPRSVDFASWLTQPVWIGELRMPLLHIVTIGVTATLLIALTAFLKLTFYGKTMRAAAADFQMARLLGVRANRVIAIAFAMSGFLAAIIAVLFVAQTGTVSPAMGLQLALVGFVATVIGGMGSLTGSVLGGYAVGIGTVVLQAMLPVALRPYREAVVYGAVILVLLLRPQGIFRSRSSVERV